MRILSAPSLRAAPLLIALGLAWPFTATADAVASATLSLHEVITRAVQMAPPQRLADESLALAQAQQDASRASLLPQLGVSASQLRQTTNPATLGFNFPGLPKLIGPYSVFADRKSKRLNSSH